MHFKDYGPGIDPYIIQSIFDDFFTYQKAGGTGLGLGYCRRTMQLFGGDITCYSAYNQYTQFSLKFPHVDGTVLPDLSLPNPTNYALPESVSVLEHSPLNLTHGEQRQPNGAQPLCKLNILVTDDQPTQLALVKRYLEPLGARLYTALNGQQAVDIVTQHPIDLVLMDIQMPVMNGFEACKLIKQTHPALPVIALSGETDEETIAEMTHTMDERLVKPTTQKQLFHMVQRFAVTNNKKIESVYVN
ncbi:response regulator [Vibrio sp. PP-XX7]